MGNLNRYRAKLFSQTLKVLKGEKDAQDQRTTARCVRCAKVAKLTQSNLRTPYYCVSCK